MKNFKKYLSFVAVFGLLLTSCSKDEEGVSNQDPEKVSLSFGAILNDLVNTNKQSDLGDLPECSGDEPAFVEVVLMQGTDTIVGADEPFRIDLVDGEVFTEDVPELELVPGDYTLTYFSVHNAAGDLLWLAPREGGTLAGFVEDALPLDISLGAGVKKYVDVPVLCYDDRDVIEYGYLFFEFDSTEAFEFCFFVNYCDPDGRHYPARYSVDISVDGTEIYSDVINITNVNNEGDPFAEPLCFALPDLAEFTDNQEYIDYTITLLDWEGVYDAADMEPITGSLSRTEIMANFDGTGNVDYEHLRFGCGDTPPGNGNGNGNGENDQDNDDVPDETDNCPGTSNSGQSNIDGDLLGDACDPDIDGDGVLNGPDLCDEVDPVTDEDGDGCEDEGGEPIVETCDMAAPGDECAVARLQDSSGYVEITSNQPYLLYVDGTNVGNISVNVEEGGSVIISATLNVGAESEFSAYEVWVSTTGSGNENVTAAECDVISDTGLTDNVVIELGDIDASYENLFIHFESNICSVVIE